MHLRGGRDDTRYGTWHESLVVSLGNRHVQRSRLHSGRQPNEYYCRCWHSRKFEHSDNGSEWFRRNCRSLYKQHLVYSYPYIRNWFGQRDPLMQSVCSRKLHGEHDGVKRYALSHSNDIHYSPTGIRIGGWRDPTNRQNETTVRLHPYSEPCPSRTCDGSCRTMEIEEAEGKESFSSK